MNAIAKLISTGKNAEEIAKITGLGRTSVYEHANGSRKVSATAAAAYMKYFDIPLNELMPELFKIENEDEKD